MFGIYDSQYIDLPQNVDRTYIEGIQLASGLSFETVIGTLDSMLAAFNTSSDPLIAALSYETTEEFMEYNMPVAFKIQAQGEYGMDRPQKGEQGGGHMLPIRGYSVATAWTEDGLRRAKLTSIENTLEGVLLGYRNKFRSEVMKRLFTATEVPVEPGHTTATSPGMAGSGTGLNAYTRPYPSGIALPGGYTHYVRTDAAGLGAALVDAAAKLKKQGHDAPYDLIAPQAQIDAIRALPGFVPTGSVLVRQSPDTEEALVDPALYVGVYADTIRIRFAIEDFTEANIAVFKTYGSLDPRNPLAIRKSDLPGEPEGVYIRSRNLFPLAEAQAMTRWGVGVSERTGAVLIHVDATGSYDPPTFTL